MTLRPSIILSFLLLSCALNAQNKDSATVKSWNDRYKKIERQDDSLEAVFYSTPPFFTISLEVNHEKTPITKNMKFYATDGHQVFRSTEKEDNRYQFNSLPDSVKFGLEFDTVKIETPFVQRRHYKFGADLTFGCFSNILELRRQWVNGKKNETFDEWDEIGEPYLHAIKEKKVIRAANKDQIRPIEFVSLSPRVFGDGPTFTYQTVRAK